MQYLQQSSVSIARPDDYFAEMLKTDVMMAKVKNRLVKQQVKIQNFEERKNRLENKKFAKAVPLFLKFSDQNS
jgi:rRNA-processing protein EBP2